MARARVWVGLAAAALAVAGCYGSTEPATKIIFDGATLNARGTANNGPAESWFEWWESASGSTHFQTATLSWPAGASGPFSQPVDHLKPNTGYSFRLCGRDIGGSTICAQTRTFTTADGDTASGVFTTNNGAQGINFHISGGPHGERATGSALVGAGSTFQRFDLNCLKVSGNRAIVAGDQGPFLMLDDTNPDVLYLPTSNAPPPCADLTPDDFTPQSYDPGGNGTVHDAP